jgi:hypothetical protein
MKGEKTKNEKVFWRSKKIKKIEKKGVGPSPF